MGRDLSPHYLVESSKSCPLLLPLANRSKEKRSFNIWMLMSQGSTGGLQSDASGNEDRGAWKVGQPEIMWRRSKKDFMILMFLSAFISELMLSIYVCFGYFRSIRILIKDLKTDDQFKFAGSKGWTQEWCCTGWKGWGEVFYILLICIQRLWPTWWIGFLTLQVNINWLGL